MQRLRDYVRTHAEAFLAQPNVTSVGIGRKMVDGRETEQLAIQFTVARKLQPEVLATERVQPLPASILIDGQEIPTDVLERRYTPGWTVVQPDALEKDARKQRLDPVRPGCSVAHVQETAGTLGAIVYDVQSGAACGLSNWHVLQGPAGKVGDMVVQPGPFDDNRTERNVLGPLLRSHLGAAGDCAIVRLDRRGADPSILGLDVVPAQVARAEIGDRVAKSGRTTGVTYGRVRRVDVMVKLDYGGAVGERVIGGFEIGPDEARDGLGDELSMGGDSGAAWMGVDAKERVTDVLLGLHFAGEGGAGADEHALACYAHAALEKLQARLSPVEADSEAARRLTRLGYDPDFLGMALPLPVAGPGLRADVLAVDGGTVVHHTHFSLSMSRSRKLALWVAWNIDGGALKAFGRKGLRFQPDPLVPADAQIGDELYASNRLDRGHLARRADLVWGPDAEAQRANSESFYFTNITPQHQAFNQSHAGGLWGALEDAIFEGADVDRLRISLMGGPLYAEDDPPYRNLRIPRAFWKLLAWRDAGAGGRLTTHAYVLTQEDLLNRIEVLNLDSFRLYEVSLATLEERTGLRFAGLDEATMLTEALPGRGRPTTPAVREVMGREDILP
jgi:endonuclease G